MYVDTEWDEFRCYIIIGYVLDVVMYASAIAWAVEAQAEIHNWLGDFGATLGAHIRQNQIMVHMLRAS